MSRETLRASIAQIGRSLRGPEEFALAWHLEGALYRAAVWLALAAAATSGTILLSRPETPVAAAQSARRAAPDEMAEAIAQVDSELDTALSSLDGWAENVLAREKGRLVELRSALACQAARIRDMDALIERTDAAACALPYDEVACDPRMVDRRTLSEQARRKNLRRLQEVRGRSYDDLMGTLAWIRELVSMIHLAKFTGAPASRAEELVAQIAAAVEGVSAVTWQDEALENGDERIVKASNPAA